MRTLKIPTGQVARWLQELNTYNLKVVHRSGKSHSNADALSRKPCKSCKHQKELQEAFESSKDNVDDDAVQEEVRAVTRSEAAKKASGFTNNQFLLDGWDLTEVATSQTSDENIGRIQIDIQEGKPRPCWNEVSASTSELKSLWRQWDRLEVKGDLLYRMFDTGDDESVYQLVTPKDRQEEVMKYHHDIPTSGHLGVEKTLARIRQAFYWPGMADTIRRYCRECDDCAANKLSRESNRAPLGQYMVGEPMERAMMDILGALPVSDAGNRYILVISDWFTKWTECVAIPDMESKTVAKAFVDCFVSRFGVPLQIYTDQGRCFESKLMEDVCELLDMEKTHATSMRPQANGMVERYNRTLISMLRSYCKTQQKEWDTYLQQVMMAYRSSPHSSTKVTPNKMVLGREVTLPMQAMIGRPQQDDRKVDCEGYAMDLGDKMRICHEIAREHIKAAATYQKRYYDSNSRKKVYSPGQLVWLHDPSRKIGVSSKLVNKWKGPYLVTRVVDDLICMVKRSSRAKAKAYHIDRLHPYRGNKVPAWIQRETM